MKQVTAGKVQAGRMFWALPVALFYSAVIALCVFLIVGWLLLAVSMRLDAFWKDVAVLLGAAVAFLAGVVWAFPGALMWATGYEVTVDSAGIAVRTLFGLWRFSPGSIAWLARYGHESHWADLHEYARSGRFIWRRTYTSGVAFGTKRGAVVLDAAAVAGGAELPAAFERFAGEHGLRFDKLDYTPRARSLHPLRRLAHRP